MTTLPDRRTSHACLIGAAAIFSVGVTSPAYADLAPAFVGKVTVDTGYVTGATSATDIAFSGDGRALVTMKGGQLRLRKADGTLTTIANPFGTVDSGSEKGLLGVVAHPTQSNTFYFYVSNGTTNADKHRVYLGLLNADNTLTLDATPIIAASRGLGPGLEGPANHDGGGLVIHDNKLYVSVGDTGFNASPPTNKYGSCLNKGNGKVLRVNLDGTIPSDNPLVGMPSVTGCNTPIGAWIDTAPDPRVFAWGFRNPFRIWVDPATGLLWIGDVGEVTQEEISVGQGNQHYGYPFEEGTRVWGNVDTKNCITLNPSRPCTPPVYSYPRSLGRAVTGGLIPDACWSTTFNGTYYMFADSSQSWIKALPVNGGRTGVSSTTPIDFGTFANTPVSFRMGPDRSLYVVFNSGVVYRFTATSGCGDVSTVPTMPPVAVLALFVALGALGLWFHRRRTR